MFVLMLAACATESEDTAAEFCEGQPEVTYESAGLGILTERCWGCHWSDLEGEDRQGAPEDLNFDVLEEVWAWAPEVVERAEGAYSSRVPARDLELLRLWLICGEPGT